LGYKHIKVDNKPDLVIDQVEADTVVMIKKLRRRGLSMGAIANRLNRDEIPTKRGGKWHASTIQYVLKNKMYKGHYQYNRIKTKRLDLAIR